MAIDVLLLLMLLIHTKTMDFNRQIIYKWIDYLTIFQSYVGLPKGNLPCDWVKYDAPEPNCNDRLGIAIWDFTGKPSAWGDD